MATYPAYTVAQCDDMLATLYDAQRALVAERMSSVSVGTINYTRRNIGELETAIDNWQRRKTQAEKAAGNSRHTYIRLRG